MPSLLDRSQCSIPRGYSHVIFRVQHTVLILDNFFHVTFWCSPQVYILSTQRIFAAPDSTVLQFCLLCGWHINLFECRWHRTLNIYENYVWGFSAILYSWKERMDHSKQNNPQPWSCTYNQCAVNTMSYLSLYKGMLCSFYKRGSSTGDAAWDVWGRRGESVAELVPEFRDGFKCRNFSIDLPNPT